MKTVCWWIEDKISVTDNSYLLISISFWAVHYISALPVGLLISHKGDTHSRILYQVKSSQVAFNVICDSRTDFTSEKMRNK